MASGMQQGAVSYGSGYTPNAQAARGMDINSIMKGWVDRGAWIYYDTISQNAGSTALSVYTPFAQGLNQNDQINTSLIKTKLQTNLPNGGMFLAPRCLILNQLGFMFTGQPATSTAPTAQSIQTLLVDIQQFCLSSYFEFRIDDKIFFEGLLEFHPSGLGFQGYSTRQGDQAWGIGLASPLATWTFGNFAKYIAPLQNFSLQIKFPGSTLPAWQTALLGGQGLTLVVLMKGWTDRSVQ